jgi:hypothetical protein
MPSLSSLFRSWFPSLFPAKTVGWLCSVTKQETQDFLTAFKGGLNDNTVQFNEKYANGDYQRANINTLTNLATQLMTAGVNVIVATGGVASLQAAVQAAKNNPHIKIPILYIVGLDLNDPTVQHGNISGGINLDMPSYDAQRAAALRAAPYNATQVGLLVNLNAAMGPKDQGNWNQGQWGPVEPRGNGETNANIPLAQAIQNLINNGADGIVVSGDPYFTSRRHSLVPLLNNHNLPVSYPFDIYKKENPRPGKSMRFGPDLIAEYTTLGTMAGQVLASSVQIPQVGKRTALNTPKAW